MSERRPRSRRPRRSNPRLADVFLAVGIPLALAAVVLVNILAFRHHARLDWTSAGLHTLSATTEELLASLDREVTAVAVLSPEHRLAEPVRDLLERYAAASPRFRVRWVDPEREPLAAREVMERSGAVPGSVVFVLGGGDGGDGGGDSDGDAEARRIVDVETLADLDVSAFERGESPRITAFHGEDAFTGALAGLLQGRRPRVLFTTGHGELSLDDTGSGGLAGARELLGGANVDIEEWSPLAASRVPPETDLVVIAGPRGPFTDDELRRLGQYLGAGGRLLVLLEPADGVADDPLTTWLADYGLEFPPGTVADPDAVPQGFTAETFYTDRVRQHPATAELAAAGGAVLFRTARVVRAGDAPPGASVRELVASSDEAFRVVGAEPLVDGLPGGLSLVAVVERFAADELPATRLVVVGDADVATSAFLLSGPANAQLLYGLFDWLVEPATSLGIEPSRPEQVRLTMAPADFRAARFLVLVLMPLLAVALGVAVWWRRRRP